jgi:superfamily II DNA or RNA helicase
VPERSAILAGLAEGSYGAVATSKVLNEGVDVPSANVAIVLSGSGSVREHVQRLGRILRKQDEQARDFVRAGGRARPARPTPASGGSEHSAYR